MKPFSPVQIQIYISIVSTFLVLQDFLFHASTHSLTQVCTACAVDFLKRCLCECGRFSLIDFVWYSMIVFQSEFDFDV